MAILAGTLYNYAGLKWLPLPGVLRRCGREAGKEFSGVAAARGSQAFWGAAARIGLILYIFFDCKLLYLYVLCHDVLLPLTMSIVYLFVSVLLLYQSVIKIDVPNKWASACVQPAIDDG